MTRHPSEAVKGISARGSSPPPSAAIRPLLIAAGILLVGCRETDPSRPSLPDMLSNGGWTCDRTSTEVISAFSSGFVQPEFRLIENSADWCDAWHTLTEKLSPPPPCDTSLVDFAKEVALLAALGTRTSGGYSVAITCVQEEPTPEDLRVLVQETTPGPECNVTLALTSPVTVVKVGRPGKSAVFVLVTEPAPPCPL